MRFVLQKEQQEAERKRVEAQGIADYQHIISESLTERQLQYEQIKAMKELAGSQNAKIIMLGSKGAHFFRCFDRAWCSQHDGHVHSLSFLARRYFAAHALHRSGGWPDEDDSGVVASMRQGWILGQEAISRMNGIGSRFTGCPDDRGDVEVAFRSRWWPN